MNCKSDFPKLKSGISATEPDAVLKLSCSFEEDLQEGATLLSAVVLNGGTANAHLDTVELSLDISELIPAHSRVIAGAGRMGSQINRFDLARAPFEIVSEQFLLFRKGLIDYFLAGILTWRTFHGELAFRNGHLKIRFPGDFKLIRPGEEVALEKVLLVRSKNWQDALAYYAKSIARLGTVSFQHASWRGWGSWDYYADKFGERQILENLVALKTDHMPCNLIQIDDGYSVWGGDWLTLKPGDFPSGMDGLAAKVEKEGCSLGIWLAPFLTHKNSSLAAEHPDWLLQTGQGPLTMAPYPYYVLDYSRDEVVAWLSDVLTTMKRSWGIRYFKLDFLLMGVKPCRSAIEGMTPLERFHRCFTAIRAALGEDAYILGCSAIFGPCIGYVDGMRTGPDIAPQFSQVKKSAFCNLSSFFLQGKVFNCDPDYLVLRSEKEEDAERTDQPSKKGNLTLQEAWLWADFISIFSHVAISGDKLSLLDKDKKEILKTVLEAGLSDECVPLDLWAGDASTIPGCILSRKGDVCRLALFNWGEEGSEMRIHGFASGECLISERDKVAFKPERGVLQIALEPHSSKILHYRGERTFDRLRRELVPEKTEAAIEFPLILGQNFKPEGKAVQLNLGSAAQCPLAIDRLTGLGMIRGNYAGVAEQDTLLGVPIRLGDPKTARVIELRSGDAPRKVSFKIGCKLKALYILHGCEYPVKGELNSYLMKFNGHVEELKLVVGVHIGNTHAHYATPWTSKIARMAWHDPRTEACLFLMEWKSPYPDETLEEIEVTWPLQPANIYIVGAAGYE